jgi:hypothetical protein
MKTLVIPVFFLSATLSFAQQTDWSSVENVFGKKGNVQGDVFKITFPRSDLSVKVGSVKIEPALALTSWVAIMKIGNENMMMGDLVLLDSEVAPALEKLTSSGLEVTAIHNHLIGESPSVKYIHYYGKGEAADLAQKIKSVIATTKTPLGTPVQTQASSFDWSKVKAILGEGKQNGALLQYNFQRNEKTTDHGMEMPPAMGTATAINFQVAGNDAAIAGDFVLLADEVNPVAKALTENRITVTAIHNHMLYDNPRLFMMHFWAIGDPERLANGLKTALDKTNVKR